MSGVAANAAVQPDWDLVPEATHYQPPIDDSGMFNPVFWRVVGGKLVEAWAVYGGKVRHYPNPVTGRDLSGRLIPRPAPVAAEWDGVGLPPVGVVCELRCLPSGAWGLAEIKYMSQTMCVWLWLRDDGGEQIELAEAPCVTRMAFRLIRTPEQIAAEEQEKVLREACEIVGCAPGSMYGIEVVKKLIDADYRKRPAP